ncbi:aldehyde dehydrogenase family protein [Yinghuangia seranimata]|uniref:aldehyde dehydrogenase family protein n=1 Tax=Yinghuangia seranimata TaxID=408067 RepID=UPI00248D0729|nr:aldehyde dehydrogenase family protein [Yinghuangia seranimata]MDI2127354.1 aldehyde dehydrogenase family protein [Yinghuangia seranimata]
MTAYDTIYIDGVWTPSSGTSVIEVVDPATERVHATVPQGTSEDVDRAVAAARRAFPAWAATPPAERAAHLAKVRDLLAERAAEMAEAVVRDLGAPAPLAQRVHVGLPIGVLGSYVRLAEEFAWEERIANSLVVREPVGVVGAITPWNYPLHQITNKVGPALAAGCTVVLKPSEVAPTAAYLFLEILDAAGIPAGVVNLVSGTGPVVGEAIAAHPDVDMVSFTGSTRAGTRVAELAAPTVKRVALELGGKSANVILPGADLEKAVRAGVNGAYLNSGQTCSALTRMLVHRDDHARAVEIAAEAAAALDGKIGPMVSAVQYERVQGYITRGVDEGATLVAGGSGRPDGVETGYYVRPTVFGDVTPEMTVAREEIFGPVLSVMAYADEADAERIANDTDYGLSGAVWAGTQEEALAFARRLRTGQVEINGGAFNPLAPFGGYKKSGNGRELGRYGLEEYLEVKSMQL